MSHDILDMSKIENGDLKLKEDIFTREDFADSISTVIAPLMEAKKINFHFSMEGTVDFIIRNLPAKGDLVGLQFTVKDTGTGMSPEVIPHMYDPFSQERSKLNDSTKGTGLGLPVHWKIRKRKLFWPVWIIICPSQLIHPCFIMSFPPILLTMCEGELLIDFYRKCN